MCLRIYLNGDGTGRGSHLSLFFVVMRGQSDALLKWPFNQKVKERQQLLIAILDKHLDTRFQFHMRFTYIFPKILEALTFSCIHFILIFVRFGKYPYI